MSASDHTPLDAPPLSEEARARELARVRNLKIVVIGLGVVLVALALVVFSTLIVRAVKGSGEKQAAASAVSANRTAVPGQSPVVSSIPPGSRVIATAIGEGRLAVTVEADRRFITILFDVATGSETGRIVLAPGPQ
jgi:Na+-transporting methylmalonyl-CoA/oxaloacetate decarboxylase gamma subunit